VADRDSNDVTAGGVDLGQPSKEAIPAAGAKWNAPLS
jgi:hypothetical protein